MNGSLGPGLQLLCRVDAGHYSLPLVTSDGPATSSRNAKDMQKLVSPNRAAEANRFALALKRL